VHAMQDVHLCHFFASSLQYDWFLQRISAFTFYYYFFSSVPDQELPFASSVEAF